MNDLELTKESFESKLDGTRLVVWFKALAMDILTDLETSSKFQELLEAASETSGVDGYIQIKDSVWDSHTDLMKLSKFITDDNELYFADGRVYGYHHEVLMARFRNTLGNCLLALRNFGKPMVAGLQGKVSAEYLGLTLLFDLRIATPDATISFDNVRTGIPSSPAITLLMPGYIGTGKTLALANQGEVITAQEALELGLISRIIEQPGDLKKACIDSIEELAVNNPDIVEFNRQHILPSGREISAALEIYYTSISKTLISRNSNES
jgi:enoyl-CoA hydratase/carnithine racemase